MILGLVLILIVIPAAVIWLVARVALFGLRVLCELAGAFARASHG